MESEHHITQSSSFENLKKVTPFSKCLAAILFITLPFVGGYIGYIYAPDKIEEFGETVIKERVPSLEASEICSAFLDNNYVFEAVDEEQKLFIRGFENSMKLSQEISASSSDTVFAHRQGEVHDEAQYLKIVFCLTDTSSSTLQVMVDGTTAYESATTTYNPGFQLVMLPFEEYAGAVADIEIAVTNLGDEPVKVMHSGITINRSLQGAIREAFGIANSKRQQDEYEQFIATLFEDEDTRFPLQDGALGDVINEAVCKETADVITTETFKDSSIVLPVLKNHEYSTDLFEDVVIWSDCKYTYVPASDALVNVHIPDFECILDENLQCYEYDSLPDESYDNLVYNDEKDPNVLDSYIQKYEKNSLWNKIGQANNDSFINTIELYSNNRNIVALLDDGMRVIELRFNTTDTEFVRKYIQLIVP